MLVQLSSILTLSLSAICQLICCHQPKTLVNLKCDFYYGKKYWAKSLFEILCCERNFLFGRVENVGERLRGLCNIENKSIWVVQSVQRGPWSCWKLASSETACNGSYWRKHRVKKMVLENRHYSLRELSQELSISHKSVRHILVDVLCMRRVAARPVPKELNFFQTEHRKRVAADMLERVNSDPTFMERIITGDETWVYEYDMQTSQQASKWCHSNQTEKTTSESLKSQGFAHCFFRYSWCCSLGISFGGSNSE